MRANNAGLHTLAQCAPLFITEVQLLGASYFSFPTGHGSSGMHEQAVTHYIQKGLANSAAAA